MDKTRTIILYMELKLTQKTESRLTQIALSLTYNMIKLQNRF